MADVDPADGDPAARGRRTAWQLLSGTSWQTVAQVVPLVVNLAMTPWVIHGLGPGRYSIFLLITGIIAVVGYLDGGIGESALRFFTIYAGRDDRVATTRLLTTVSTLVAALFLVVAVVVLLFADELMAFFRVSEALRAEAEFLLFVMVPVMGLIFLRNAYVSVVYARQRFAVMAIARLLGQAAYIVLVVATVLQGWGLYGIAVAQAVQGLVVALIAVPVGLGYLDRRGIRFVSRAEFVEFLRYAWKVQVTGIVLLVTYQKDQLVAGRVLSAQASGPFGQGTSFATQFGLMPYNAVTPIQALTGQRVGALGATQARPTVEAVQAIWVKAVTGWCVVGAPAAYFGVHAWLPDSFALAAPVAAILIFGQVFWLMPAVTVVWCLTLGHPEVEMRAGIAALLTNVALSLALFSVLGMMGVVLATALGRLATTLSVSWDAARRPAVPLRWFLRDVPLLAAVCGFGTSVGLGYLASDLLPNGALGLLSAALVAVVPSLLYVLLAFDRAQLRGALAAIRRRSR